MLVRFGTQSYQHPARQLSSQRMVNAFLEKQPQGTKSPIASLRTPGIEDYITLPETPIRGMATHNNKAHAVAGDSLYRLDNGGYVSLGTIPGEDRVRMFSNGAQLGIVAQRNLYVYETSLAQVTDAGYSSAIDATYLDLFGVFVKPNSADIFIFYLYSI